MFKKLLLLFTSLTICLLGILLSQPPSLPTLSLPAPLDITNIPHIVHLTEDNVDLVRGVRGGESLVLYQGDVVTGTLDGYLVGLDPGSLEVKWRVKCPAGHQGGRCRILGLREVGGELFGVDLSGRLFKFQSGQFEWLFTSDAAGFFNDLVVHEDMIYLTDSFTSNDDRKLSMLQRFYSLQPDGRILSYNITSREVSVLADKLHIPNGIELHNNNRSVLVSEGSMYRILEVDIKSGETVRVFSRTLGAVDNIRRSAGGGYWLGVSTGRTTQHHLSDLLARYPRLRYLLTQHHLSAPLFSLFPRLLAEQPRFYKADNTGVISSVVVGDRRVTDTVAFSEVLQVAGSLFVGSPFSHLFRVRLE